MKKNLSIWIFICCAVLFSLRAEAAGLAELLNQINTMQADFSQTIFDNKGKAVQQSFGKMLLSRPGKFRWQVVKPLPQLVIANDTKLWIYDPDLQQVTIRTINNMKGETPALLLSHKNEALDKEFNIKEVTDEKSGTQQFVLTPKNKNSMFASIQMSFNHNLLQKMQLQDHLGHHTAIEFKNTKINLPLPEESFVFKAPANVDVIDETRKQ